MAGCATAYRPAGAGGGYSETLYSPDVFRVHFDGNDHTPVERSRDFALLRAADLTLHHGYRYFSVTDNSPATATYAPPTSTVQNVQVNNYNYGDTYNSHRGMQWNDDNGTASRNAGNGLANFANYMAAQQQLRQMAQVEILVHCFAVMPAGIEAFDAAFLATSLRQKYGIKEPAPAAPPAQQSQPQTGSRSGHYVGAGKAVNNGVEQPYQIALDVSDSGQIVFICTGVVNNQQVAVKGTGVVDANGNVTVQNEFGDVGHGTLSRNALTAGGKSPDGSIQSFFTAYKQ